MIQCKKYGRLEIFKKVVGLNIFLLVLMSGGALGATSITQCGNIVSSGDYVLGQDIWSSGNMAVSSCINITSSNVVFDGESHYIIGNSAEVGTIGVYINNPASIITNVTVKNVNVTRWDSGIYLKNSSDNNVTGNNASNNSNGINLFNSNNNFIYNNYFNNTNNVIIDSSINYWNTTKRSGKNIINGSYIGGNYWGDPDGNGWSQTCPISNIYGMCDSPYVIDPGNKDFLPLTKLLPTQRFITGKVLDNVTRLGIAGVNVSLNNSNSTITDVDGFYSFMVEPDTFEITATFDMRYYTNNSVIVSTVSIPVVEQDILLVKKPTGTITGKVSGYSMITISSPENIFYHTTEIPLIVSADKIISLWQYSLNGAANVTFTLPTTITASQGQNNLIVYAQDSTGKWDSNSVSFSVDSIPPASVDNLQNVSYALDYINWTWADPADEDFEKVLVYLDGVPRGEVPKGVMYYNATGLEQATYTIGTRTVDINGTENATLRTHTAATILPAERYINGTVMEKGTTNGISGVTVTTNTLVSTMTNETGFYSLSLTSGSFDLAAALEPGYYTNSSVSVSTELRAVTIQDIELVMKPTGNITGIVSG